MRRVVCSGNPTLVATMQASHFGERNDPSLFRPLDWSSFGRIFIQSQVGSTSVIVDKVGSEQALEVTLVEHYDVIQTIASDRTDQTFNVRRSCPG